MTPPPVSPAPNGRESNDPHRLPLTVTPAHYALTLEPDLDAATFSGTARISVTISEPTTTVVLNAIELDLDAAVVELADGTTVAARVDLDPDTERATLTLEAEIPAGEATVDISYRGVLNDQLRGFYRSTFTDTDGNDRVIATTQFESTSARRAFPCWDEPAIKATFGVTLVVPADQFAVSCSAIESEETNDDGKRVVRFATTMKMSTYLVAFIVGPLEATDPVDAGGTPLRIVHPIGKGHLTDFGLAAGAFSLEWFSDYFGIAYPGDKVDMIAVPDFAMGAMENLGCVTFREVLLLADPDAVTQPELMRVKNVIAHELAHMWFGDLVTMSWWNGLWLKEAFATFMEMKATDAFRPEWDQWTEFGLMKSAAYDIDSLQATRPVEFPVVSPDDAEGMYDLLTYEKGAALVRMLEQYLGEDRFRDGIRAYLTKHAYATADTGDLWDAIEESSGEPIRRVMDTWIFQGGYPLVSVELDDAGTTLTLRQQRFAYSASTAGNADGGSGTPGSDALWAVPVIVATGSGGARTEHRVLLDGPDTTITLDGPADWVLANAGGHGFYRGAYAPALLDALVARVQDHLSPIERYNLVDDTVASMLAGETTSEQLLGVLRAFSDEDDSAVWKRIASALAQLSRLLDDDDDRARLRAGVRELAGPALDIAGWEPAEGESDRQREMRAALFSLLGTTGGDADVQARAATLHQAHLDDPGSVDPPLVVAAINVLAHVGAAETFDLFVAQADAADTPQDKLRYTTILGDFDDDALMDRTLERCTDGSIRTQDAPMVLRRALANRGQAARVWSFIAANWDDLFERFPSNTIIRMVDSVKFFTDPSMASDVVAFFETHEIPQDAKGLEQLLEQLRVNVALADRERSVLAAAL